MGVIWGDIIDDCLAIKENKHAAAFRFLYKPVWFREMLHIMSFYLTISNQLEEKKQQHIPRNEHKSFNDSHHLLQMTIFSLVCLFSLSTLLFYFCYK